MCEIACLCVPHSVHRASLWWSLPTVYRAWGLGAPKETMAHNFDHCWQTWHKVRQHLQVDSCHLRKPVVTMQQITNRLQISVFQLCASQINDLQPATVAQMDILAQWMVLSH